MFERLESTYYVLVKSRKKQVYKEEPNLILTKKNPN